MVLADDVDVWRGFIAEELECAEFRFDGNSIVMTNSAQNAKRRLEGISV